MGKNKHNAIPLNIEDDFGNRKGGRKQAHRFSGVAAQRRAARKARNIRKSK